MKARRKVSATLKEFGAEIDRLARFDGENQSRSGGKKASISNRQLQMLTEAIFFAAFRAYENFVRDVFLLYCQEKPVPSGRRVRSYLRPRGFEHAEELVQSSMPFLDWASPDTLISRAEIYLRDGFPIKPVYASQKTVLSEMKQLRNHIAHRSPQSLAGYRRVLLRYYTVVPLKIPEPGEFLLQPARLAPQKHMLVFYLDVLRGVARDIT